MLEINFFYILGESKGTQKRKWMTTHCYKNPHPMLQKTVKVFERINAV